MLTLAGINLVVMINVAVVVETVFAWPGIGRLLYEGITFRDFPVVQGVVLIGGAMIVMVNLLVDILYAVIDPRIRLEKLTAMTVITPVTTDTIVSATPFWRLKGFPLIPVSILLFIAFVAVFADLLAPHDPEIGSLARRFKPPFWLEGGSLAYLLGTDHLGRDVLSRLIFGARVSMVVGFTAVLVAGVHRHRCSASSPAISAAGSTR